MAKRSKPPAEDAGDAAAQPKGEPNSVQDVLAEGAQSTVLQVTLENLNQGISVFDKSLRLVAWNNLFLELLEFPREFGELHRPFADFIRYNAERGEYGPGDVDRLTEERVELALRFEPHRFERTRPDGTIIEVAGNPMPNGGFATTYTDVSNRKRAEKALRLTQHSIDQADVAVIWHGPNGLVRFVNDAACRMFGYSREEFFRLRATDFSESADLKDWPQHWEDMKHGGVRINETVHRTKSGRRFPVKCIVNFVEYGDSEYICAICEDISERETAEQALRTSEERFRDFAESASDWFWEMGPDLEFTYGSDRFYEITGWRREEIYGRGREFLVHPELEDLAGEKWRDHFARLGRHEPFANFEYAARSKNGPFKNLSLSGLPVFAADGTFLGYRGTGSDITEQKQQQEQLRQAQKMEAVGQLTGGVAHDFNNLLAVIMGNLELLLENTEPGGKISGLANKALAATLRGADLTHRLLAFSRRQPLRPVSVDVNRLAHDMQDLLVRTLGEAIGIELVGGAGLWRCDVDPGQLENTILNLSINARDAMPQGGRLTIETSNARLDDAYAAAQADVAPGQYVLLAISDTGSGMPPEVIAQAFDPFFSTKDAGRGSGLGLSMIYGFVKQSGGHARIYSEVGEGTTMKIYLPRSTASVAGPPETTARAVADTAARGEVVMVVEDDVDVRKVAVSILSEQGYEVHEAGTAAAALALIERTQKINLLLTDVILPGGMGGRELADRACDLVPGLKVLFMSGYSENAIIHHGRLDEGVQLLAKPFGRADLATKVREILDGVR
ncbi:MAG: PAS-domain containing protein [Alphaproteobacteria bacterium]|jgi:PAS domain S-box-containing protein|nr:PAS-domain containing protein [Alphaproteobacteria bacterium]